MRSYFSQFGQILRLRLSRNKKTGASKHYAFIEFADQEVADIAAETMHNYLLFGHILKCKPVPRDNLEYVESLFKGANKRFIPKPAAKIQKYQHDRKRTAEEWDAKMQAENKRRKSLDGKWKKSGIEYEFDPPEVGKPEPMEVDEVVQTEVEVVRDPVPEPEDAPKTIEPAKTELEEEAAAVGDGIADLEAKVTKGKKGKKEKKAPKEKLEKPVKKAEKTRKVEVVEKVRDKAEKKVKVVKKTEEVPAEVEEVSKTKEKKQKLAGKTRKVEKAEEVSGKSSEKKQKAEKPAEGKPKKTKKAKA